MTPAAHFDPVIVDAFLARFDDFRDARTQSGEGMSFEAFCQENPVFTVLV